MAQTEQKNQNVNKQFEELQSLLERAMALQTSMVLFEWDDETLAPKGAAEHTARVIGSLSEQYQEILASMRFKELLDACQKAEKRMRAYLMRCSRQFSGKQPRSRSGFPAFRRRNTVRMQNLRRVRRESGRVRERKMILLHLPLF